MVASPAVLNFIHAALECSVYVAPRDFGLTLQELIESGHAAGFREGELGDAVRQDFPRHYGTGRIYPDPHRVILWT